MKGKSSEKLRKPLILTVLLNVLLLVAIIYLMNYVQGLLYSDLQINLMEVATQNKDVITSKLNVEVNNLDMAAGQIAELLKSEGDADNASLQHAVTAYSEKSGDDELFVAGRTGDAFFGDRQIVNIAGRRYYQYAMQGEQNISERLISRLSGGDEVFVICVPLTLRGEVVGTVQKFYSPEKMYDLCAISLFSSQGSMYIINSEGYIQISSQNREYSLENDNYYRTLYAQGNRNAAKTLEEDIRSGRDGFMETVVDGQKMLSAYTMVEDIRDWYLISSVATTAVTSNANTVVKLFYFILCMVVLVFAASLLYFFVYKNKQQAALTHAAFVDTITQGNTFNKFLFDLLEILREHPGKQFTILCFDIDNFKYVNNFYGFDIGDCILQRIYNDVAGKLQTNESMARISGDHFVLLLEDASPARMEQLLPLVRMEEGVPVYLSAGSYVIVDPNESVNLMVDKASSAAQLEKGVLKKKIVPYSVQFEEKIMHNEQLKREIGEALNNGEIIPFYQPKVDVNTGKLVGAEALARWRRADGKMVFPSDFIPLCEKTGQIVDLDLAIFEQVLEFLSRNLNEGIACVPISINFSRLHLTSTDFIHSIVQRLERFGVPSKYIEIELTESVIFDNHEMIIEFANHLHEHGLLISMDDFGSGYSSLNLLKDIPIDVLKIDKGFLDVTENRNRQRIILSTIASMAKQLQTSVVVEGVETAENVAMMREFGCDVAQGYFFAKPMEETKFEEICKEGVV